MCMNRFSQRGNRQGKGHGKVSKVSKSEPQFHNGGGHWNPEKHKAEAERERYLVPFSFLKPYPHWDIAKYVYGNTCTYIFNLHLFEMNLVDM